MFLDYFTLQEKESSGEAVVNCVTGIHLTSGGTSSVCL